jgi:hypothetical protein
METEQITLEPTGEDRRYAFHRQSFVRSIEFSLPDFPNDKRSYDEQAREFTRAMVDIERIFGTDVIFIDKTPRGRIRISRLNKHQNPGILSKAYTSVKNYIKSRF